MSDERLDELAQSARNRGLRLVRSRVRTPGKRRFGKVGLADPAGKPVLGIDAKGPTASPEEVEDYLRNLVVGDWGASLGGTARPRKRKAKVPKPKPKPKPKPAPRPAVREARAADAPRLVELIRYLGHPIDEKTLRRNLARLARIGEPPLVAAEGGRVIGLCGLHTTLTIHRDAPLGRITNLVVAEEAHGRGIGRMLVEDVERRLRKLGCKMVEVTSNERRGEAHAFYRHLGYERTSVRFFKTL